MGAGTTIECLIEGTQVSETHCVIWKKCLGFKCLRDNVCDSSPALCLINKSLTVISIYTIYKNGFYRLFKKK